MTEAEKLKHLEFIQNVITRMNVNSFQIKGWAITIVAATLALYASTKNEWFVLVGIIPSFLFWVLDAIYLTQEKRFRELYTDIVGITKHQENLEPFTMDIKPYKEVKPFWKTFRSDTITYLYVTIIITLFVLFSILMFINFNKGVCHG